MKWKLISNPFSTVHVFHLMEANAIKEVLRYNPLQQSARITCMGKQRLFFIEQVSSRNNHFAFKNEYGFDIGRLSIENFHAEGGTIEIEEKKFHYRLFTNSVSELVIYEHDHVQPLVTCSFIKGPESVSHNKKETIHEYASLLLGLCWYLFNPSFSENNIDYKPALSLA